MQKKVKKVHITDKDVVREAKRLEITVSFTSNEVVRTGYDGEKYPLFCSQDFMVRVIRKSDGAEVSFETLPYEDSYDRITYAPFHRLRGLNPYSDDPIVFPYLPIRKISAKTRKEIARDYADADIPDGFIPVSGFFSYSFDSEKNRVIATPRAEVAKASDYVVLLKTSRFCLGDLDYAVDEADDFFEALKDCTWALSENAILEKGDIHSYEGYCSFLGEKRESFDRLVEIGQNPDIDYFASEDIATLPWCWGSTIADIRDICTVSDDYEGALPSWFNRTLGKSDFSVKGLGKGVVTIEEDIPFYSELGVIVTCKFTPEKAKQPVKFSFYSDVFDIDKMLTGHIADELDDCDASLGIIGEAIFEEDNDKPQFPNNGIMLDMSYCDCDNIRYAVKHPEIVKGFMETLAMLLNQVLPSRYYELCNRNEKPSSIKLAFLGCYRTKDEDSESAEMVVLDEKWLKMFNACKIPVIPYNQHKWVGVWNYAPPAFHEPSYETTAYARAILEVALEDAELKPLPNHHNSISIRYIARVFHKETGAELLFPCKNGYDDGELSMAEDGSQTITLNDGREIPLSDMISVDYSQLDGAIISTKWDVAGDSDYYFELIPVEAMLWTRTDDAETLEYREKGYFLYAQTYDCEGISFKTMKRLSAFNRFGTIEFKCVSDSMNDYLAPNDAELDKYRIGPSILIGVDDTDDEELD